MFGDGETMGLVRAVVWSALAVGAALTMAVALAGQGLALATFAGRLPAADASGATSLYAVLAVPWFAVFWLYQVRREGWHRQRLQPHIRLGVALREHPVRTLAGLYAALTFVGLAILGGLSNKGLAIRGGQAYIIHTHGFLTPISCAEYQHQAAYPLWMFSAAVLFIAALVLGLALPHSPRSSTRLVRLARRYV